MIHQMMELKWIVEIWSEFVKSCTNPNNLKRNISSKRIYYNMRENAK